MFQISRFDALILTVAIHMYQSPALIRMTFLLFFMLAVQRENCELLNLMFELMFNHCQF